MSDVFQLKSLRNNSTTKCGSKIKNGKQLPRKKFLIVENIHAAQFIKEPPKV